MAQTDQGKFMYLKLLYLIAMTNKNQVVSDLPIFTVQILCTTKQKARALN